MSLYYNNFQYLDKNSLDQGLIVASFEPDDGFTDSFLSMELVQENYYDGTKKFDYGARYNTTAVINITVIKSDGSDFSLADTRSISKWLTGSKVNSWLNVGHTRFKTKEDDENYKDNDENIVYAFLGRVTNLQPRKMDGRIVAFKIEFTSVSPWAFSIPQEFTCTIGQMMNILENNSDIVLVKLDSNGNVFVDKYQFGIDVNGNDNILCPDSSAQTGFEFDDTDGTVYINNAFKTTINNQSDDLYTYIYLDIDYQNKNGTYIVIRNDTLDEITRINNVSVNENIQISSKQFILSSISTKLFGDDFNFVWPRLQPGLNDFVIDGDGNGYAEFTYRYPIKVGDCAMDIDTHGGSVYCGNHSL